MKQFVIFSIMFTMSFISVDADVIRRARGAIKYKTSALSRQEGSEEPIYGNNIPGNEAQIADQYFKMEPNASYEFGYLQTDLQRRQEEATFKEDPENEQYVLEKVTGYYKYVRPDGKWQRVDYEADENGFRPVVAVIEDEPTIDESVFDLLNKGNTEGTEAAENTESTGERRKRKRY